MIRVEEVANLALNRTMALSLMMMLNSMGGHVLGRRTTSRITRRFLSRTSLELVGIGAAAVRELPQKNHLL
jgi:hypothetical protein